MKGSKFILLLMLSVILVGIAWYMTKEREGERQQVASSIGEEIFGGLPLNEVAVVRLQDAENTVTLRRNADGWIVEERMGYPASFQKVSALIKKLASLKTVQRLSVAEQDRGAFQLLEPEANSQKGNTGILFSLQDISGEELASMILGKVLLTDQPGLPRGMASEPTGRYVLRGKSADEVDLVSDVFSDLQVSPSAWLVKDFVRPGLIKRIEVQANDPARSWVLERKDHESPWELAGAKKGESVDTNKTLNLESFLDGMSVADVASGEDDPRVKTLQEKPIKVLADTFSGMRYEFTIGEGEGDELPVQVKVEELQDGSNDEPNAETKMLRVEKLEDAGRYAGKVVFIPRNFLAPFFTGRDAVVLKKTTP